MIPFEFRHDLWHQKTRVMGLSCRVVCVILRLAVLIQYRSVTDTQTHRQTDRHTHRHTTMAYTALSIASRGKNQQYTCVVITNFLKIGQTAAEVSHPTFLPREAMLSTVYAVVVCLCVSVCVCLCVCLSHSGIVSKRLNVGSRKQCRTIAP